MTRKNTLAQDQSPASPAPEVEGATPPEAVVDAWWSSILAGNIYEPHPVHGPSVKVHLDGGRLRLSGELESARDRKELIAQARSRIGHGIDRVDSSDLAIARRDEEPGILDQTLISAFPNRAAAEYARDFVITHSRIEPEHHDIVVNDEDDHLHELLPENFIAKARKWLDAGHALLVLRVDETAAHRVRELLEEDTRSQWTVAAPPTLKEAKR
jgi:hypothetical protein